MLSSDLKSSESSCFLALLFETLGLYSILSFSSLQFLVCFCGEFDSENGTTLFETFFLLDFASFEVMFSELSLRGCLIDFRIDLAPSSIRLVR